MQAKTSEYRTVNPPEQKVSSSWGHLLERTDIKESKIKLTTPVPDTFPELYLVSDVFSASECKALIAASEEVGYGYTNYPKHYRGNLRLITTDNTMTEVMYERLKDLVPQTVECEGCTWDIIGLNNCWRLAKYFPHDRFQRHCDAAYVHSSSERSMFTVNIYMNGNFEGGKTRFYGGKNKQTILYEAIPETGQCVIFRQPPGAAYSHDGEELRSNVKYLFRTDIMYRKREISS